MEIKDFTSELVLKEGIYHSKKKKDISYPESGNEDLFTIEDGSFWFNHRNKCIKEAFKKYSKKNLFFDIGGGNGYISKALEDMGVETFLIEPGFSGCQNALKRGLKNIVCSTLEEANFKQESIPNIGVFDVVEHIENDVDFLKMIYTFLEKDGLIFITVPAYEAIWSNEDDDAGHYRRYTTPSLKKKLEGIGFEIEYSTYLFSLLPLPIFLFRSIPSKLGLNKNSNNVQKHQKEHTVKNGLVSKISNYFWNNEIDRIKRGKKIAMGSSCFIIARKK